MSCMFCLLVFRNPIYKVKTMTTIFMLFSTHARYSTISGSIRILFIRSTVKSWRCSVREKNYVVISTYRHAVICEGYTICFSYNNACARYSLPDSLSNSHGVVPGLVEYVAKLWSSFKTQKSFAFY